jgi:metallo-beta-lactamase family protein
MATVTFHGAAQEVTGSCHLLESPSLGRVLLDCGLQQGGDALDRLHQQEFPFSPASIDAVVLSHAHLDHSGMLHKLVHQGFNGDIYCTKATADLLAIMLKDSVGLYQRDLERTNHRRERSGKKLLKAEFTLQDVKKVLSLCKTTTYEKPIAISKKAHLTFLDAGHILGSSIVKIELEEKGQTKTLVFSGDLGKTDSVLMNSPTKVENADIVLMEGTYGDRNHRCMEDTLNQLETILKDTWKKGGNVMIPAFAVGRTQELIFHLGCLYHQGRLDHWQVFLDSPMAISVTQVYDKWLNLLDEQDTKVLDKHNREALEDFLPTLKLSITTEQSMAINRIKKGAIIIAGSGMCTGGRIRQHFKHRIWNKKNTVIFVGFQAGRTLGRQIVDGKKTIKMFGEEFVVKANIETLGCFSAHAGQSELIDWISEFQSNPKVMLVHGESKALDTLSQKLWNDYGIASEIPTRGSSIAF